MKLYYSPGACSLSPHIALREAGLPVELVKVNIRSKTMVQEGDFWAINSKGSVPVLELPNGDRLTEGPAIAQYIADQNPASKLAPQAGTFERYRLLEILNYITSEVHKGFSPLFNAQASEEWKEASRTMLGKKFDWLTSFLGSKSYLLGEQFTVADGYLFTTLLWTRRVNIDLKQWPVLQAFFERVLARPKVQEALAAEKVELQ